MKIDLNGFNKWKKRFIALLSDISMTIIAWLGAVWLANTSTIAHSFFAITLIQSSSYIFCGLYRGVWRFASVPDLIRILRAVFIGNFLSFCFIEFNGYSFPIKLYIIYSLLLIVLLSGTRLLFRWLRDYRSFFVEGKRVLVVGAGSAGEGIIRDLYRSSSLQKYIPVAIVDDDKTKRGCEVHGVRVVGPCSAIPLLTIKHEIELILIAIPSASSKRMREIVEYCEESNIPFRTLPGLRNITDGHVTVNSIRDVLIEDLLGREEVHLDWGAIQASITDKIVLVTGGGGSIGSELCRQICSLSPKKIIVIDNNEFNLYSIDMELTKCIDKDKLHSHLCSVTDKTELQRLFAHYNPHLVFHVAAYKHVPLLETHVRVSMYNNIIGTKIVAELAAQYSVNTFVLISTDKAVNPTSVMGATKRASEIICQTYNLQSSTRYITVRFGNVLDSAGSVIPLFRKQLQTGGPLTVTHPDISRYFMTIPEASQLILQASTMHQEGDIFVLDMGEPINIRYLAEQMIKLSGKIVSQDIEIQYTGLRPGEKLYEELFHENENICETSHAKIKQAKVRVYNWEQLNIMLNEIETAYLDDDEEKLICLLCRLVPEYQSSLNNSVHKFAVSNYALSLT